MIPSTDDLLQTLTGFAAMPQEAAITLPGVAYSAIGFFAHEQATILGRGWHCLGRCDEVPEPGDFFTTELLGEPLLVVRGDDGTIRVLSNLCRHRLMPLAEGRGNADKFICPYHAWTYTREGGLRSAPRMKNTTLDPASCRLPQFRSEEWNGFLYVSLDDDAPPLHPAVEGLSALLAPYAPDAFRIAHVAEEIWQCNWKCLVENFMEGYHLSVVHPVTLHGYTPTALSRKFEGGEGYTGYHANYPQNTPPRGSGNTGLTDEQRHRSTLFCVYPCQVASQAANLLVSLSLQPLAPDSVRVKWTLSVWADELDEETIAERVALWEEVNREDREKLERLQRGLSARRADAGPLAPADYEGTIHDFHQYLARSI